MENKFKIGDRVRVVQCDEDTLYELETLEPWYYGIVIKSAINILLNLTVYKN